MRNEITPSAKSENSPGQWTDLMEPTQTTWDDLARSESAPPESTPLSPAETPIIIPESFTGSAFESHLDDDAYGFLDTELLPDLPDGTPQILWRGERVYLGDIDQIGTKPLSAKGNESSANRDGSRLCTARDKRFAFSYALGKDGVKFYDAPLSAAEIPIGVIYRINNQDNHLAMSSEDEVDGFFLTQQREYATAGEIPPEDYEPTAFILMNDLKKFVPRSDFRMPLEVFEVDHKRIKEPGYLKSVIDSVKDHHQSLADSR